MTIKWGINYSFKLDSLMLFTPYLIGGSYVVKKHEANDIDVVMHEYHKNPTLEANLRKSGFWRLSQGDKRYDEIESVRIVDIYEGRIDETKVNIIVVGAVFWPAYVGAINEMAANPEYYQERDARVALHRELSREIVKIARIEMPEGAL